MTQRPETPIDTASLISSWIDATNTHDTATYMAFFTETAELDDPSVGERFDRDGIAGYFEDYFIGYNTTTRLVGMSDEKDHIHVIVEFTGDFPGGRTGGTFDVTLEGELISFLRADLT